MILWPGKIFYFVNVARLIQKLDIPDLELPKRGNLHGKLRPLFPLDSLRMHVHGHTSVLQLRIQESVHNQA